MIVFLLFFISAFGILKKALKKKLVYDLINFCFMQTLLLMLFLAVISLLYTILELYLCPS